MKDPAIEDIDVTFGIKPDSKESDGDRLVLDPHDHHWVARRLAVGGAVWRKSDVQTLKNASITHVIDCMSTAGEEKTLLGSGIEYFHCPTEDDGKKKGDEWFRPGVQYGLSVLARPNTRLLVHCAAGINRGPSMAFAILRAKGWSRSQAESSIRRARPIVKLFYMADADRWIEREWNR